MGYYEPSWSAEEQTMIDLMELKGFGFGASIDRDCTVIRLYTPDNTFPLLFKDDTEYGALRKAFKFASEDKGNEYA